MMAVLCGIGVPASLTLYNIDLDSVLHWMKPVAYAAIILAMPLSARQARKPIPDGGDSRQAAV